MLWTTWLLWTTWFEVYLIGMDFSITSKSTNWILMDLRRLTAIITKEYYLHIKKLNYESATKLLWKVRNNRCFSTCSLTKHILLKPLQMRASGNTEWPAIWFVVYRKLGLSTMITQNCLYVLPSEGGGRLLISTQVRFAKILNIWYTGIASVKYAQI
jgi:hypothetical protein